VVHVLLTTELVVVPVLYILVPPPFLFCFSQPLFFVSPGPSARAKQFFYYNMLSSVALELNLRLPATPKATISIPIIMSATANINAKRGMPILAGCAKTMRDITMLNIPTKISAALDHHAWLLSINPCINLAIPLNNKAIAPNIIKNAADSSGYAIATEASINTSTPIPIFTMLDDILVDAADIPLAILSIPTMNKTTEINITTVTIADAGDANTAIESPIEISPKTTCNNLSHRGDLFCDASNGRLL
jgi:hypothetical protein